MRRNSDSAAPSPYTPIQQPMQYQPGLQTPQQQQQALHQQHIQTQMAQADAQAQNDPQVSYLSLLIAGIALTVGQMQAMRRQQEMEARMVYEKKMHQDQAMRSMQLGQQPHTPNMSALDASSPLQQGSVSGASPRNAMSARHMQRESSKGGSMLPPQSPATTTQRTSTPKPVSSSKTPKMMKEDLAVCPKFLHHSLDRANRSFQQREGVPPKSLVPSPNNGLIPMGVDSNDSSSTHNLTPSPPTPNDQTNAIQAPASVPSLSAGSNSLSFATNTDLATDGGFNLEASSGEFDFASLDGLGEVNFDFGLYLAELDGEGGDGEIGVVP